MENSEFLGQAISHLIREGKSIRLISRNAVKCDGQLTGGFYTENGLHLATKHNSWFETFCHEYCHFLQELDEDYDGEQGCADAWADYDEWLNHDIELDSKTLAKYTKVIRDCEIDCEKRTVGLIKEYGLDIDTERYTQEANVYAQFYTLATKYRRWYDGHSPCSIPELADMMPTTFKTRWDRVPKKFEEIVKEKCFRLV